MAFDDIVRDNDPNNGMKIVGPTAAPTITTTIVTIQ
jgi:hypothetical protein